MRPIQTRGTGRAWMPPWCLRNNRNLEGVQSECTTQASTLCLLLASALALYHPEAVASMRFSPHFRRRGGIPRPTPSLLRMFPIHRHMPSSCAPHLHPSLSRPAACSWAHLPHCHLRQPHQGFLRFSHRPLHISPGAPPPIVIIATSINLPPRGEINRIDNHSRYYSVACLCCAAHSFLRAI